MNKKSFINNYILPSIMTILIIIVWQSANFLKISRTALSGIMERKLPYKENTLIIGGEIASSFYDEIADNEIYTLPEITGIKNGYQSTYIIGYYVQYPLSVINKKSVWNLTIEFRGLEFGQYTPNNFNVIKVAIYIDLNDDKKDGGVSAFYKDEKINFQNDFKWDYFVEFDYLHEKGLMHSYSTKIIYPVDLLYFKKNNSIRVSLPIVEKINKKMNKYYMGKHIVLVGIYTPLEKSGLLSKGQGVITPYYDMLCNEVKNYKNILTLIPIDVNNIIMKDYKKNLDLILKILNELKEEKYESRYSLDKILNEGLKQAKLFYNENIYSDAEKIFKIYKNNSSIANTYLGTIYAKKAGNKSLSRIKKLNFVYSAYKYFDKAESLLKNDTELYYLLKNRYQVSISVPDDVFGKLEQAKDDLVSLTKLNISNEEKAGYYCILIDIFKKRNNIRELRLLEHELKKEYDLK